LSAYLTDWRMLCSILILGVLTACITRKETNKGEYVQIPVEQQDSIASKEAFEKVYAVLKHPRCLNCHPAGDIPLQGEDSHVHSMKPRR